MKKMTLCIIGGLMGLTICFSCTALVQTEDNDDDVTFWSKMATLDAALYNCTAKVNTWRNKNVTALIRETWKVLHDNLENCSLAYQTTIKNNAGFDPSTQGIDTHSSSSEVGIQYEQEALLPGQDTDPGYTGDANNDWKEIATMDINIYKQSQGHEWRHKRDKDEITKARLYLDKYHYQIGIGYYERMKANTDIFPDK